MGLPSFDAKNTSTGCQKKVTIEGKKNSYDVVKPILFIISDRISSAFFDVYSYSFLHAARDQNVTKAAKNEEIKLVLD